MANNFIYQVIAVFTLLLFLHPAHSIEPVREGYCFTTKESDWGLAHTFVSADGFKKTLIQQKLTVVTSKPNWQVIAFQTGVKQICEVTSREQPLRSLPPSTRVMRIKCRLKGLPVIKETYYFKPMEYNETESMVGAFMPSGDAIKNRLSIVGLEFTQFNAPEFSNKLLYSSARAMSVPLGQGITIEHRWIVKGGKRLGGWSLVDWKNVPIKISAFAPPQNYKRCNSFHELIGKSVATEMDDVAKQMNFGEPLGRPSSR